MTRAVEILIISLAISVVLLVGVPIIAGISDAQDGIGGQRVEYDHAILDGDGDFESFADSAGTNEIVYKTTGFAINFTGANDSEVSGTQIDSFGNSTDWHVSVWARPDSGTGRDTMQVTAISDGEMIIYYNGSASEWRAWYYKQSTRDSYEVSIAAPTPVQNYTNIQVRANDSHLAIFRNATEGGATDITVSSSVDAPTEATNWNGRVEELRTFEESQNSTTISNLQSNPTEQRPGLNRSARLMFDQPTRDTTLILPSGTTADTNNLSYAAGFPEQIMDLKTAQNDLAGTSDYRWETDGPQIAPVNTGELDGAPVAYASYDEPATGFAVTQLLNWYGVAALVPMVLIAAHIIVQVRQ